MLWVHTPISAGEAEQLSKSAGVGPVLAELLLRAGHRDPGLAAEFLRPDLSRLEDPFLVGNVVPAVARLKAAISGREKVIVLGDYDVDGVSSTALLVLVLRRFGLDPTFVVPRRSEDGYGLSRSAIDRALEVGRPGLFIALDCGTNSHEEVAYLVGQGIDVLVVDHHRSKDRALEQGLLINPHVAGTGGVAPQADGELAASHLPFRAKHFFAVAVANGTVDRIHRGGLDGDQHLVGFRQRGRRRTRDFEHVARRTVGVQFDRSHEMCMSQGVLPGGSVGRFTRSSIGSPDS